MKVEEIMSRSVRTVRRDTKLVEVSSVMCLYRISGLPVIEDNNRLVGIVAERDVMHRMFPSLEDLMKGGGMANMNLDEAMNHYQEVMHLRVADVMTANPISVSPDMHILRAAASMVRRNFRRIPVADGETLVGMLSLGDVHKAVFQKTITGQFGG